MTYLISLIENGYADREMENTVYFLNKISKDSVCKHIKGIFEMSIIDITRYDTIVLADYPYNCDSIKNVICNGILDKYKKIGCKIVYWKGDIRFKYNFKEYYEAIGTYSVMLNYGTEWFGPKYCKPTTWKELFNNLPLNCTLSETQCYWGPFDKSKEKIYDVTFITNSNIVNRLKTVDILNKVKAKFKIGRWNKYNIDVLNKFLEKPNVDILVNDLFGKDWINELSKAKYTIISDFDFTEMRSLLSSRFWESLRAETLPLIDIHKDPEKLLYKGYDILTEYCYYNSSGDIQTIVDYNVYDICKNQMRQYLWDKVTKYMEVK